MSKSLLASLLGISFLVFIVFSVLSYPSSDPTGVIPFPTVTPTATPSAPYIFLIPDCSEGPSVEVNTYGVNWDTNEDVIVSWSGSSAGAPSIISGHSGFFFITRVFSETNGIYEVRAESTGTGARKDISTAEFQIPCPKEVESLPQSVDIIANKNSDQGIVKRTLQAMYGPLICTNWGDPYSPWGSQFKPGTHTQRYKIEIPSDYPSDIVRVELFDPDSINNDVITTTVQRTNVAYKCRFRIFEPNGLSIPKPKSLLFYSNW